MRFIDAFNVFSYSFQILVLCAPAAPLKTFVVVEAGLAGISLPVQFS